VLFSYLMLGPSPFFTWLPENMATQSIALLLLGMGAGFGNVPAMPYMSQILHDRAPANLSAVDIGSSPSNVPVPEDHGTGSAISSLIAMSFSLGSIIGPLLGSALTDQFSFGWASTLYAGLLILLIVFLILMWLTGILPTNVQTTNPAATTSGISSEISDPKSPLIPP